MAVSHFSNMAQEPMKYDKLRIASSTICGITCLLLIALWVRSYSYIDTFICYRGGNWYGIQSLPGYLQATFMADAGVSDGWFFRSGMPVDDQYSRLVFGWLGNFRTVLRGHCAHWLAAIFLAVLGILPWIKWRFGLRTLFVIMTFVATALGLTLALLRFW